MTILLIQRDSTLMERGKTMRRKQLIVAQIADHITGAYKPHEKPIILMWRETMNGFNLSLNPDYPVWCRDDQSVHKHWKQWGQDVVSILREQHKLTAVNVSRVIRERRDHGDPPDRDKRRTDAWYRSCLSSAFHMTFGV